MSLMLNTICIFFFFFYILIFYFIFAGLTHTGSGLSMPVSLQTNIPLGSDLGTGDTKICFGSWIRGMTGGQRSVCMIYSSLQPSFCS